jgi:hypothetical protein
MQNIMINNKVLGEFEIWTQKHRNAPRLQNHEVMKALLFKYGNNATLEYKIPRYNPRSRHTGIIDYIDDDMAIEIDDGTNIKSVLKLFYAKETMHKDILWVLLLTHGKGTSSRQRAEKWGIPILRVYFGGYKFHWEYIIDSGG